MDFRVYIIYRQSFGFFFFFLTDNVDMENYADHNTEGLESLYQIDIEENVIMSADSSFHWSCDSHIKSS